MDFAARLAAGASPLNFPTPTRFTMHSAIIDRAELCVHRNKMLNGRAAIGSLPMSARQAEAACLSCTAIWRTARARDRLIGFRCRLHRANECAHELAFQLRRQGIDSTPLPARNSR